jgi:hypothetical protein
VVLGFTVYYLRCTVALPSLKDDSGSEAHALPSTDRLYGLNGIPRTCHIHYETADTPQDIPHPRPLAPSVYPVLVPSYLPTRQDVPPSPDPHFDLTDSQTDLDLDIR